MRNFFYYLGPGNNAKTVQEVFSRRTWWQQTQLKVDQFDVRGCHCIWTQWYKPINFIFQKKANHERNIGVESVPQFTYNKLEQNYELADKTQLFKNVCNYYNMRGENPFERAFPLTFNISSASDEDEQYLQFLEAFQKQEHENGGQVWIMKPGEDTNRG